MGIGNTGQATSQLYDSFLSDGSFGREQIQPPTDGDEGKRLALQQLLERNEATVRRRFRVLGLSNGVGFDQYRQSLGVLPLALRQYQRFCEDYEAIIPWYLKETSTKWDDSGVRQTVSRLLGTLDEVLGPEHEYWLDQRQDLRALVLKEEVPQDVLTDALEKRNFLRNALGVSEDSLESETKKIGLALAKKKFSLKPADWWQSFLKLQQDIMTGDEELLNAFMRFVDVLPEIQDDPDLIFGHLREYFTREQISKLEKLLPVAPGSSKTGILKYLITKVTRKFVATSLEAAAQEGYAGSIEAGIVRGAVTIMAKQFIAGATGPEALPRMRQMAKEGQGIIADILGEATTNEEEAQKYLQTYLDLIDTMAADKKLIAASRQQQEIEYSHPVFAAKNQYDFEISLKLSSLYSQWKPEDPEGTASAVKERLCLVLDKIQAHEDKGIKVGLTIDLEQFEYRDLTYKILKEVLMEDEYKQMENVGVVVQGYLKDAEAIINDLASWSKARRAAGGGESILIRLVKGAYWDYEEMQASQRGLPHSVFPKKQMSDANFERLIDVLYNKAGSLRAAIGSHNVRSLSYAIAHARARGVATELQELFGLNDPQVRRNLVREKIRHRIYTPVGSLFTGMAYLARRILENASQQSFLNMSRQGVDFDTLMQNPRTPNLWHGHRDRVAHPEQVTSLADPFVNEPLTDFSREEELEKIKRALAEYQPIHLDGANQRMLVTNPSNPDEVLGSVSKGNPEDANHAVSLAKQHAKSWEKVDVETRAMALLKSAALMRQQKAELTALIMLESGKIVREADADVAEAIDFLEYYAREAVKLTNENPALIKPRGVTAVIAPWNFPLAILTGMVAAALVTGNTVVMKPAEQTPLIGALLNDILRKGGVPAGAINYVSGDGVVGKALVQNPDVKSVVFTGSFDVGYNKIYAEAMPRGVNVIAEMGGKNTMIIDRDAHPDDVVKYILQSKFGFSGQKCSALDRLIFVGDEDHVRKQIERLIKAARDLKFGDVRDFGNASGPVIDKEAHDRLMALIGRVVKENQGVLLLDGRNIASTPLSDRSLSVVEGRSSPAVGQKSGHFINPTIFEIPPEQWCSEIFQDENFGPVLALTRVDTLEEAMILAQLSKYGLTGGIITRSPSAEELAEGKWIRVGNLYINRNITGAIVGRHDFGGINLSGIAGSKAGGPHYLKQFVTMESTQELELKNFAGDMSAQNVFRRVAKRAEARMANPEIRQPDILGEENRLIYGARGHGWIVFGKNSSLAEVSALLGMALAAGNDVTVSYSSDHSDPSDRSDKSDIVRLKSLVASTNSGQNIRFVPHPENDEALTEMASSHNVRWIGFANKKDADARILKASTVMAPGQNFIRNIINPHDIFAEEEIVFQSLTEHRLISKNTARHGFVAKKSPLRPPLLKGERGGFNTKHFDPSAEARKKLPLAPSPLFDKAGIAVLETGCDFEEFGSEMGAIGKGASRVRSQGIVPVNGRTRDAPVQPVRPAPMFRSGRMSLFGRGVMGQGFKTMFRVGR